MAGRAGLAGAQGRMYRTSLVTSTWTTCAERCLGAFRTSTTKNATGPRVNRGVVSFVQAMRTAPSVKRRVCGMLS